MKRFKRADRVSSLVKGILGELISQSLHDPQARQAVITKVELGDDLRLATVGFMVISGDRVAALTGLERARSFLRRELGRRLSMKVTPDLRFRYDDSLDAVARIDEILNDIRDSENEAG